MGKPDDRYKGGLDSSKPGAEGRAVACGAGPGVRLQKLGLTSAAVYLLLVITPQINLGSPLLNYLNSIVASVVFAVLSVLLVLQVARVHLRPLNEVFAGVLAAGAWQAADWGAGRGDVLRLYLGPAGNLAFIFLCLMAGRLLSRILREPNLLLPVGVVAILADIFTVAVGPTAKVLEKAPGLFEKLSVGLPAAGSAAGPAGAQGLTMVAGMGLGDFIFLALFLTAAARFAFPLGRGGWFIAVPVCLALATVLVLWGLGVPIVGIPLLPFIAGGFLVAYAGRFHLSRAEKWGLLWGGLFLAVLLTAAAWAMRG